MSASVNLVKDNPPTWNDETGHIDPACRCNRCRILIANQLFPGVHLELSTLPMRYWPSGGPLVLHSGWTN